jgi:zinc transport system permease protein
VSPPLLFADSFWLDPLNTRPLIALVLVSLCCGAVGSLVVGSRMAFFSDALAHCAFAGVSVGFVLFDLILVRLGLAGKDDFWDWVTPIMLAFGALIGCGIAYIRGRTTLASDTVIGVFFAGAIGLAAMLNRLFRRRELFNLEDFLFGNPATVQPVHLYLLAGLVVLTFVTMALLYNKLLLDNFNSSLALSRRVPVFLCRYLFIVLLAVLVNLCLRFVGVMLINALLIVPAATAINCTRNLRQLFWLTVALSLFVPLAGQWLSWEVAVRYDVDLGIPGTVVMVCVGLFLLSLVVGPAAGRLYDFVSRRGEGAAVVAAPKKQDLQ